MVILCDMHSLIPVGFFFFFSFSFSCHFFPFKSMNDFLPERLFAVVVIKCFMIGVNA